MVPLSPPNNHVETRNFTKRVFTSAIAGPLAVAAVMLGSPYVDILAGILLLVLLWEWSIMTTVPLTSPTYNTGWIILATIIFPSLPTVPVIGIGLAALLYSLYRSYKVGAKFWISLVVFAGPVYMGLGIASLLCLAKTVPLTLLWGLLIVWATDTGAYVLGSLVGGPQMAPRISPSKTWSGFMGGSIVGTALGVTIAPLCQIAMTHELVLFALTVAVTLVGHLGDLLESAAKRFFKVKDSSRLFPGHGGLLDRMDSLLLVGMFLFVLKIIRFL